VVSAAAAAPAWSIVDLALGVGLLLSMLVGVWRGLLKEMLSLMGWVVAYFAAQWWGPKAGAFVPVGEAGTRLNVLAGMMVVFVAVWLGWAVLTWAVREIVRASGLGGTDRLLGGVFGLMRGMLVALVVYTLVSMTPMRQWAPWTESRAIPWLQVVVEGLRPVLPDEVVKFLPAAA
jgi:membrane protein required for colicin V production